MIDWIVDNLLGSWGRPVVDFSLEFAVPITVVVVAYGVVLTFWHLRLRPFRVVAVREASRIVGRADVQRKATVNPSSVRSALATNLDWGAIAREVGEGTLVAGRWGLWPRRATPETLASLIPVDELARDAVAARATA